MWLESIERMNGYLKGKAIDGDGKSKLIDVKSTWQLKMPVASRSKFTAATNLVDWRLADAADYLDSASLGHKAAGNSHQVYAVNHQGLRLVVPAIVFCKALFVPNATTFEYLYRPSGIDSLLAPIRRPTGMAVTLIPRIIRQHEPISRSNMARLQWLYCFPSARAAFDSVYVNAARGVIGLDLPKIYADISFRGQLLEGTLFVSALTVNRFKTLETPFDWAGTQPEEYELTGENVSAHLNPVLKNNHLIEGAAGWGLSDFEWSRLQHLFPSGNKRATGQRARGLVSAILTKLGSGTGWSIANASFGTTSAVSSYYQSCLRSGRWQEIESTLMAIRREECILST